MQYLSQRYYDATTGRFNRLDPFIGNSADPQSYHKYAYVHGNPIGGIDPLGLAADFTLIGLGKSMAIGALRVHTILNILHLDKVESLPTSSTDLTSSIR